MLHAPAGLTHTTHVASYSIQLITNKPLYYCNSVGMLISKRINSKRKTLATTHLENRDKNKSSINNNKYVNCHIRKSLNLTSPDVLMTRSGGVHVPV